METTAATQEPAEEGAGVEEGELRLGSTERGAAANGVILALTRAARSFLLYDPSNEAIRHFLGALRSAVEGFLSTYGELPLVVRPFELVVHGEIVYLDRDRERSLAFRLYRDGVRRVTLQPGLMWQELLKLLEVLSIRYTGVRQAEDDMVVLLWKAGFTNIQLEAVEGFVPEEEVGDLGGPAATSGGKHIEIPGDFDLPAPTLGPLGPLRYRAIAEQELHRIHDEDSTQALPALCVRLIRELLRVVTDATEPMALGEIIPQLREIRDFLLSEGLLASVLETVVLLNSARLEDAADARERDALVASFVDERALARLLHTVPRDATVAPPEMIDLLDRVPGNHLRSIMTVLETERGEASRRVARSLIERYVPRSGAWIVEQLGAMDANLALELLRALAAADPRRGLEGAQAVANRPELELQFEVLHVIDGQPLNPSSIQILQGYLAASTEEVRVRALEQLGRRAVKSSFPVVLDRVKREAPLRMGQREAEAAGEALARMDIGRALDAFREWIRPRGFFTGILPGQSTLQWVAVSGLVFVPAEEAEALIKHVADRAGTELARHCTASMVRRRRLQRGAGG